VLVVNRPEAEALSGATGSADELAGALGGRLGIETVVVSDSRPGAAAELGAAVLARR
jgi:sugar/nucleoside kinase (ribokinase family)